MDEVSTGEVMRRLDRFEARLDGFESLLRDFVLRVASQQEVYARDQRETDRRFIDSDRDLQQEVADRKAAVAEVKSGQEKQGTNWRQAIYAGLIPGVLFLVTVLLQLKGGGV